MSVHKILLAAGSSGLNDQWITLLGSNTANDYAYFISNDSSANSYGVGITGTENFVYSLDSTGSVNYQYKFDNGVNCTVLGSHYDASTLYFTGRNSSGYIFLSDSTNISNTGLLGYGSSVYKNNLGTGGYTVLGKESGSDFVLLNFDTDLSTQDGYSSFRIYSSTGEENSFEVMCSGDYAYIVGFAQDNNSYPSDYQLITAKINMSSTGSITWKKRIGDVTYNVFGSGIAVSSSNVYVCGRTTNGNDGIIAKYNATSGNALKYYKLLSANSVSVVDICTTPTEDVLFVGQDGDDLFICKSNTNFGESWQKGITKSGYKITPSAISTDGTYLYISATESTTSGLYANTATIKISVDGITPATYGLYTVYNSSLTFNEVSAIQANTTSGLGISMKSFSPSVSTLSKTTTTYTANTTTF